MLRISGPFPRQRGKGLLRRHLIGQRVELAPDHRAAVVGFLQQLVIGARNLQIPPLGNARRDAALGGVVDQPLLAGPQHRTLIIGSALAGSTLILLADSAVRAIDLPTGRLPLGVFTALLGGPLFIAMLRRRSGEF